MESMIWVDTLEITHLLKTGIISSVLILLNDCITSLMKPCKA